MHPFEGLGWWYRGWQDSISSSWQLQVKVFCAILLVAAFAVLSTSYFTHSWPFGSPGARSVQEKAVKTALDATLSDGSNSVPTPTEPTIHIAPGSLNASKTFNGIQLCPDPDGDGYFVPCKSSFSIDQFSSPAQP